MTSFEWRRKSSNHFGEVLAPVAIVKLRSTRGVFVPVLTYIDSGAIVTLLRRTVADELGISLDAGRRIVLSNVGGAQTEAFVHELPIRFSEADEAVNAPVAFATNDRVPNLLGRVGIFDRFQITFDPARRETRIVPR